MSVKIFSKDDVHENTTFLSQVHEKSRDYAEARKIVLVSEIYSIYHYLVPQTFSKMLGRKERKTGEVHKMFNRRMIFRLL